MLRIMAGMRLKRWIGGLAILCWAIGAVSWAQVSREERREGFQELFNGKDTRGWRVYSGPAWKVENGELIGPTDGQGWIGTEKEYDNFVLRGEYWVDKGETHESNSGIFIRASREGMPWVDGHEIQVSLQDEKNPTGSIYNRVSTSLPLMREIAPEKQWNRFEIRACKGRIQVWFNDQQVQDAELYDRLRGVIGVQQHHPGVTIKYRNLRLKPLKPYECDEDWKPLFNGKDLTGWFVTGKAQWSVEEGAIVGKGGMGHLFTDLKAKNFEFRAMMRIRVPEGSQFKPNNGIYFRAVPNPENRDQWPTGFEAQVWNHTGTDYITGSLYNRKAASRLITRDGAWFSMRIRAVNNQIQIWVNGVLVTEAQSSDFLEGHFAIQCHDPWTIIETKHIYWREVK